MKNPWKTLASKEVYRTSFGYSLREDKVINPAGKESTYTVLDGKEFVVILPLNDNDEVTLVRQWRYTINKETLEVPAGKIDFPGESPQKAAIRELKEETGLTAKNWTYLGAHYSSNGVTSLKGHIYVATELERKKPMPDEDEVFEIETLPFSRVYTKVLTNEIDDARSILAILLAKAALSLRV
jgi:ADP-ribose diphosphatase